MWKTRMGGRANRTCAISSDEEMEGGGLAAGGKEIGEDCDQTASQLERISIILKGQGITILIHKD